jgi:hypothetical protein
MAGMRLLIFNALKVAQSSAAKIIVEKKTNQLAREELKSSIF